MGLPDFPSKICDTNNKSDGGGVLDSAGGLSQYVSAAHRGQGVAVSHVLRILRLDGATLIRFIIAHDQPTGRCATRSNHGVLEDITHPFWVREPRLPDGALVCSSEDMMRLIDHDELEVRDPAAAAVARCAASEPT